MLRDRHGKDATAAHARGARLTAHDLSLGADLTAGIRVRRAGEGGTAAVQAALTLGTLGVSASRGHTLATDLGVVRAGGRGRDSTAEKIQDPIVVVGFHHAPKASC